MKLNRDTIKLLAIIAMTFNHFAQGLLDPGSLTYDLFVDIGHFTAITMCFFLVEGYHYTHDKKKYALRLFIFGLISEIPYVFAIGFYEEGFFEPNVMFSLLICFCIIHLINTKIPGIFRVFLIIVLIAVSVVCDCSFVLPIAAILFEKNRNNKKNLILSFLFIFVLFSSMQFLLFISKYETFVSLIHAIGAGIGIIVSAVVLLWFYSGEKNGGMIKLNRWFFYIYYPLHLTVIAVIKWYGSAISRLFIV